MKVIASSFSIPLAILTLSVIMVGCGHTNNLAKYDIAGRTATFRAYSSASGSSSVVVDSPDNESIIADIAAMVGSGVLSSQARQKLSRAINTDSIAQSVGRGIQSSTFDYLSLRPVDRDADFIVETELTNFELVSGSSGLRARVCAESRVIDRMTGGLVWEDSEAHTIVISNTFVAAIGPDVVRTGAGVFNAIQLVNMDENEIRAVIDHAAEQAGREIGETLREDVADMHGR